MYNHGEIVLWLRSGALKRLQLIASWGLRRSVQNYKDYLAVCYMCADSWDRAIHLHRQLHLPSLIGFNFKLHSHINPKLLDSLRDWFVIKCTKQVLIEPVYHIRLGFMGFTFIPLKAHTEQPPSSLINHSYFR